MTRHLHKCCLSSFAHRAIALMLLLNYSGISHGYPEFSGDGYFSCTSCHVSASGGDLVTAYGRSFLKRRSRPFILRGRHSRFTARQPLPNGY